MDRNDFIMALFDNGNGLTLNQIQTIEKILPDNIPDGMIEDIAKDFDCTDDPGIMDSALYLARDVFMDSLHDCGDMLALRDKLDTLAIGNVTDMQVYHLWYALANRQN